MIDSAVCQSSRAARQATIKPSQLFSSISGSIASIAAPESTDNEAMTLVASRRMAKRLTVESLSLPELFSATIFAYASE